MSFPRLAQYPASAHCCCSCRFYGSPHRCLTCWSVSSHLLRSHRSTCSSLNFAFMYSIWCTFRVLIMNDDIFTSIIRPPDIVCRRTYILPVFFSSSIFLSFFRRLISEVAERNSTKIGHMVGSKCNLKAHVRNLGYPLLLQIGGPKTTFLDDFAT